MCHFGWRALRIPAGKDRAAEVDQGTRNANRQEGIPELLMGTLHEEARRLAIPELTSDVSRTAQPFFGHFGFAVVDYGDPVLTGVAVPNASMRETLVR